MKAAREKTATHIIRGSRLLSPWIAVRICAILAGAFVITALLPIFSVGNTFDISLQVPAGEDTAATDYDSADLELYYLSGRGNDLDESDFSDDEVVASLYDPDSNIGKAVISNTYQISELSTADGIPVELLALSEFELDYSIVYVSVSEANVRSIPSSSGELIGKIKYSDNVMRVGIGSAWTRIQMEDLSEGYVISSFLTTSFIATPTPTPSPTPTPTPKPKVTETSASGTYYAKGVLNVRTGPGTQYSLVKTLSAGDPVEVVAKTSNGWFKTIKGTYVVASLVTSTKPGSGTTPGSGVTPVDPSLNDLATYAKSFIGVPYVYTGMSTSGFDCSGFVAYVYANYYNMYLYHQSAVISQSGTAVSVENIKVGDVVCYDYNRDGVVDHVALYIGGGKIVHASSSNHQVVLASLSMSFVTTIRRFV